MTAMYGQAFALDPDAFDEDRLPELVMVTDGTKVEILITPEGAESWTPPPGVDILSLFQDRIEWALGPDQQGTTPKEMLKAIGYNMPMMLFGSNEFDTYEEALSAAQELIANMSEGVAS